MRDFRSVKRIPAMTVVAAGVVLAFAGCATQDWVKDYVKQSTDPIEARVKQSETRLAQTDTRVQQVAADTAAARSLAEEDARKTDSVDKRVSQALADVNKRTLVQATELYYRSGHFVLDAKQKEQLDAVNTMLVQNPEYTAHIIGEADKPGSDQFNAELSWRRALEVERYLASKNDDALVNRIAAVGEGEARATSPRADAEHRKVTIAIYKPLAD